MLVVMFFRAAVLLGVFRQLRRDGKRYFAAMRSRTTAFVFRRPRVVHTMCCKMGFACTFGESVREESVWPVAMASRHFARRFLTERYGTAARVHTCFCRALPQRQHARSAILHRGDSGSGRQQRGGAQLIRSMRGGGRGDRGGSSTAAESAATEAATAATTPSNPSRAAATKTKTAQPSKLRKPACT